MTEIKYTDAAQHVLNLAVEYGKGYRHEFFMPEHLLYALLDKENFRAALNIFYKPERLDESVEDFLKHTESVPESMEYEMQLSLQMQELLEEAARKLVSSSAETIDIPHLADALLSLDESWASYMLKDALCGREPDFMRELIEICDMDSWLEDMDGADKPRDTSWRQHVTCMNDLYTGHHPLIGREAELTRTIQVLCRHDKNNPLHVGEPGVGKTALVWGLARMIEEHKVPPRLEGSRIYQLDMGTLLAGTQYRGDFENRIKQIMDGVQAESENNIVYIDEIHTLVGAGATGEGAMDASNMLKPYLEGGRLRFIGSTTYEEYNRYFSRSKGLTRRFSQIDIAEPTVKQTVDIIRNLLPRYEEFHGVKYDDEAVRFAVEASARHINERFLPDKAIDLIDEAGASMQMQPDKHPIGKKEIADVLSKTCKVDAFAEADTDEYQCLENLSDRMKDKIYGQDEAIDRVVEAVQMSRAGLLDDNKPMASLLFVGPTGVGKTEVAKVLSSELGSELIRFDMSEYTEKHAVAKLIGAPAGYVGYEDGGLLTDAVRKSPNCVLLLDEIEKAHPDIYNILLQVMDYARLTDNKGRHADFRNAVVIMTSNAGAQYASQASVGFNSSVSRGQAMMKQVKKTFKPEFLNRLSGTVIFRDMDKEMATLILRKKLRELESKLTARNVRMYLTDEAFAHLLTEGYTPEYGAREMDRVISHRLKPLLMREILFGRMKQGGEITIDCKDGHLYVG